VKAQPPGCTTAIKQQCDSSACRAASPWLAASLQLFSADFTNFRRAACSFLFPLSLPLPLYAAISVTFFAKCNKKERLLGGLPAAIRIFPIRNSCLSVYARGRCRGYEYCCIQRLGHGGGRSCCHGRYGYWDPGGAVDNAYCLDKHNSNGARV